MSTTTATAVPALTPDQPIIARRLAMLTATVLVGLSAGFFFAYEASVTLGLAQVSDTTYVESFQAINATVRNVAFGIVFFGSLPALVVALATNWAVVSGAVRALLILALSLYVAGVAITFTGHIPLNNELATLGEVTPQLASEAREEFEALWNRLNMLRTLAFVGSSVALAAAAVSRVPAVGTMPDPQ